MQDSCLGKTITGQEDILGVYDNNRFYLTQHKCGKGAFKVVYLGIDTQNQTNEFVIISIIKPYAIKPAAERKRITNERNLLREINHPNVIRFIHDEYDNVRREVIFVTEHLLNGDLDQKMRIVKNSEIGRFSNEAIVKIIIQTLRGLAHIHSLGIIHRDIKLDNLLVAFDGSLRVADLGHVAFGRVQKCHQFLSSHSGDAVAAADAIAAGAQRSRARRMYSTNTR